MQLCIARHRHCSIMGLRAHDSFEITVCDALCRNKKPREKAEVLTAARKVEGLLRGAGISVSCDDTDEHSPGQKFRAW